MKYRSRWRIFMRNNKYLEKIGLPKKSFHFNSYKLRKSFKPSHIRERYLYCMDSRETYDLCNTYAEWLYTRLSMYKEQAGQYINLSFHKFEYDGAEYTLEELIDKILDLCKVYFKHIKYDSVEILTDSWNPNISYKKERDAYESMQEATRILAIIIPALWW